MLRPLSVALPVLLLAAPALARECAMVRSASYAATRSVSTPAGSASAKIYVSGRNIREEIGEGAAMEVRITAGSGPQIVFNPQAGVGARLPSAAGVARRAKGSIRVEKTTQGDGTVLVRTLGLADGKWEAVAEVTCRADGVLVQGRFKAPDGGSVTIRDSNVVVGPQPASLFAAPKNIRFVAPGARPPG